jgi:tripartite-type tricarboxylate transporter receptor subunit TctC
VKRRQVLAGALVGVGGGREASAWAAGPAPLRIVLAYPPGGASDAIVRALVDRLAAPLAMPVIVTYRPGAGGAVAMDEIARAPADGRTLCFSAITALTLRPHLAPVRYDPLRDIAPVAAVMTTPVLVAGTPALRAKSFGAMLDEARRRPGRLRWASSGLGTTGHLVCRRVAQLAGVDITHVPYKGGGQQLVDALAGQFEVLSTNVAPLQLTHVGTGRLTALALGAPSRLPVLAAVPTLAELGFAPANRVSVFGLFAPGGTPGDVLERLNGEVDRAARDPAIRDVLLAANNQPGGGSRAAFVQQIAQEWAANRELLDGPAGDRLR